MATAAFERAADLVRHLMDQHGSHTPDMVTQILAHAESGQRGPRLSGKKGLQLAMVQGCAPDSMCLPTS